VRSRISLMGFLCEREGGRGGEGVRGRRARVGVGWDLAPTAIRDREETAGGEDRRAAGSRGGRGGGRTCETTCSADSLILLNAPMRGDALADTSVMA
jgi:hypothetical protein